MRSDERMNKGKLPNHRVDQLETDRKWDFTDDMSIHHKETHDNHVDGRSLKDGLHGRAKANLGVSTSWSEMPAHSPSSHSLGQVILSINYPSANSLFNPFPK